MSGSVTVVDAQREVRSVFLCGSVGQAVSGTVWIASAVAATWVSAKAGIILLVAGGFFIFPLTQTVLRILGKPSALPSANPLNALAIQVAFIVPLLTEWDDDWAAHMADSLKDMKLDPRIPPLATDAQLRDLRVRTLVLGADEDISFPGQAMVERARELMPDVETELLRSCRHCPPTTPEFRTWLAARVTTFLNATKDA